MLMALMYKNKLQKYIKKFKIIGYYYYNKFI